MPGVFGSVFGGATLFPALSIVTTADLIRDRIINVIESLAPLTYPKPGFMRYLNEGPANFLKWCEQEPASAFRRFQVRDTGDDQPPPVSNTDVEERLVKFQIIVAYPQTARTGTKQALDRDTAMSKDQHMIEHAIGMAGRGNFIAPNPDACWRSGQTVRIVGASCDFLQITQTMSFRRAMNVIG